MGTWQMLVGVAIGVTLVISAVFVAGWLLFDWRSRVLVRREQR